MQLERISKQQLLADLPHEWPQNLFPKIRQQVLDSRRTVVVLDDDPTGTQTVHGVPVLTEWSVEALRNEFQRGGTAFYVLTNSRSLPANEAAALNTKIGRNLLEAGRLAKRCFVVISRSDSTLRGHFPDEVEALADGLETDFDAWLLIPFFLEGGRYTIHNIHYVADGDWLVPAAQTEFARDPVFGYQSSDLRRWVEEKTAGRIAVDTIASISIEEIRHDGPGRVAEHLCNLQHGQVCVVNAASYRDLEVFSSALLAAEAQGKRFLYRTAASIVRVRAGIASRNLLVSSELDLPPEGGGLVVVGSHVPRSTSQVEELSALSGLLSVELNVEALLDEERRNPEIEHVAKAADSGLARGQDVMIVTSRKLVVGADANSNLSMGHRVASGLVDVVRRISVRPRYILAKGGITSSDTATQALNVKRGQVLGQILPGVPVWRLGPECRYPGIAYIVFPGNVGERRALAEIVSSLRGSTGNIR